MSKRSRAKNDFMTSVSTPQREVVDWNNNILQESMKNENEKTQIKVWLGILMRPYFTAAE
jgi:hypothetical protein